MKEIVRILKKNNKSGNQTLYLEYMLNGKRHQESLRMFLYPETSPIYKKRNKATMAAAVVIQSQRILQLQNSMAGITTSSREIFTEFFRKYIDERTDGNYRKTMESALLWWVKANGESLRIGDIDKSHMLTYSTTLKDNLAQASANNYYNKVSTVLGKAVRDGLIPTNPAKSLDRNEKPKARSAERRFLTIEEVMRLKVTPCRNDILKRAFLFSCFTGLRFSDIVTLRWEMIEEERISKRMVKTGEVVYLPLSENAIGCLPDKGDKESYVFRLKSERQNARDLSSWIKEAGIDKHITFHCARHTFACLLITFGTDIYTTSKLLGHANVSTTAIYAHLVDMKKTEAVNSIPKI